MPAILDPNTALVAVIALAGFAVIGIPVRAMLRGGPSPPAWTALLAAVILVAAIALAALNSAATVTAGLGSVWQTAVAAMWVVLGSVVLDLARVRQDALAFAFGLAGLSVLLTVFAFQALVGPAGVLPGLVGMILTAGAMSGVVLERLIMTRMGR